MMVTKEQAKKCLDKFANDYLSTREETECFDYAIKAVDAYNEPKDGLEKMIADCDRHIVCKGCPHEKECE